MLVRKNIFLMNFMMTSCVNLFVARYVSPARDICVGHENCAFCRVRSTCSVIIYPSFLTVIRLDFPHLVHWTYRLGFPDAFHLIPPNSHIDILCPHEHVNFHNLDSSSIPFAHDFGTSDVVNFCVEFMYGCSVLLHRTVG